MFLVSTPITEMMFAAALGLAMLLTVEAGHSRSARAPSSPHHSGLEVEDSFRDCNDCPEMVVVPAGSFTMGTPDGEIGRNTWEGPQHIVAFARPFALGKFEVTVDQFAAFVRETGYDTGSRCWTFEEGQFKERSNRSWRNPGFVQKGSHPAACLNWYDATAYADWLAKKTAGKGYRLATEAEWEYAARARNTPGSGPRYSFGDDEQTICAHGNGLDRAAHEIRGIITMDFLPCSDGYAYTAPVGTFAANGFGLHDLLGNVKEWTKDCYHAGQGYRGAPADGSAWMAGDCRTRVLRGGSWLSYARLLRAGFRYRNSPGDRLSDFGMRVAKTLAAF